MDGRFRRFTMPEGVRVLRIEVNGEVMRGEAEVTVDIHPLVMYKEVSFLLGNTDGETMTVTMRAGSGRVVVSDETG